MRPSSFPLSGFLLHAFGAEMLAKARQESFYPGHSSDIRRLHARLHLSLRGRQRTHPADWPENPALGKFVAVLRQRNREGTIPRTWRTVLEKIGFDFSEAVSETPETQWPDTGNLASAQPQIETGRS